MSRSRVEVIVILTEGWRSVGKVMSCSVVHSGIPSSMTSFYNGTL